MQFKDFQAGCHGGHLGYQDGTILAIINLHVSPMPSTKFGFNPIFSLWEQITTEDFQTGYNGSHLGYSNKMVLAILNLHVTPMPPTKFWLIPT